MHTFNPSNLTVGELVLIEDVAGHEAAAALLEGNITPKALRALVLVALRRQNPDATLDDADAVEVVNLGDLFGSPESPDPTDDAA